jgi:hypothetical protein
MEEDPSALDGIREYWETLGRQAANPAITQGCMITNATLDVGEDDEIREYLHWVFSYYDKAFKKALDRAVKLGGAEVRYGYYSPCAISIGYGNAEPSSVRECCEGVET